MIKKYKHGIPMLFYMLFYFICFSYLEDVNITKVKIIYTPIDDIIPFIEFFVVPYFLWFFYVAVVAIYLFFKDVENFNRTCLFLGIGMTVFLLISMLVPNGHNLRPTEFVRDNIFTDMVQFLYTIDTPTNIFPSIHVFNSIVIHIAVTKSEKLASNKLIKNGSLILSLSIIFATVFLKQHSALDVYSACVLAFASYFIVYSNLFFKKKVRC